MDAIDLINEQFVHAYLKKKKISISLDGVLVPR